MTITMTGKHQITIPRIIAEALGLGKGSMFDVELHKNRIELIPVELKEKEFTKEEYRKLDLLFKRGRGNEKKVTKQTIARMKKGKI